MGFVLSGSTCWVHDSLLAALMSVSFLAMRVQAGFWFNLTCLSIVWSDFGFLHSNKYTKYLLPRH